MAKTWLITGCSTGVGRSLANAVLDRGDNAVTTARDPSSVRDIVEWYPATALALALDVTNRRQIEIALLLAEEAFGGVDVVVNAAAHCYRAAVEEASEAEVAELFATNFFGAVAVIKAALPGMRRRQGGTIVNLYPSAVRDARPGSGYCAASKIALVGLSDALREEVEPFGIRVLVLETGGLRTDTAGASKGADREGAVQAIMAAVDDPEAPVPLTLGADAVARAAVDVNRWRADRVGTDFATDTHESTSDCADDKA